jgi:tight adherence protein B
VILLAAGAAILAVALLLPERTTWRLQRIGVMRREPRMHRSIPTLLGVIGIGPHSARRRATQRAQAITALAALAAELRAGQPPQIALDRVDTGLWPRALTAVRLGGDVAAALRLDARDIGSLRGLAACWEVAERTGSGLATAVSRLAIVARTAEDVRVQLEAQLAGPRATARMLAVLPLIGILLGSMIGADPLGWLLGTVPGVMCLVAGAVLTALGVLWTNAIARQVERLL